MTGGEVGADVVVAVGDPHVAYPLRHDPSVLLAATQMKLVVTSVPWQKPVPAEQVAHRVAGVGAVVVGGADGAVVDAACAVVGLSVVQST